MIVLRRILGKTEKPADTPPAEIVDLREAVTAARLARRLATNRRPTGNRYGDALAGYERPERTEERRDLAD